MNFHQTEAYARFLRLIGWRVEICGAVRAFVRPLPFLPISFMKLQRVSVNRINWDWVKRLERKYHVYETVIEPDELSPTPPQIDARLLSRGFKPATDFMLTTKTRIIDLTAAEATMLAAMKPKTRYNIHVAEKHHLKTKVWTMDTVVGDEFLFQNYYELLVRNAKRIKMLLLPKAWIRKQFVAFGNRGFVVGAISVDSTALLNAAAFFTSKDTCSYSHNGSTTLGRKQMAPTLTIWEGIREGKRRGLTRFDFDGVYDERFPTQKRFQGFGRFKEGFGGEELYFPPMYRRFRWPF